MSGNSMMGFRLFIIFWNNNNLGKPETLGALVILGTLQKTEQQLTSIYFR